MGDWAPVCQQQMIYSLSGHHGWGHDCGRPVKNRRVAERKLGLFCSVLQERSGCGTSNPGTGGLSAHSALVSRVSNPLSTLKLEGKGAIGMRTW